MKYNCFEEFLRIIDIFGTSTELKIKKKSKYKTSSGGIFTILYLSLALYLFFSFGDDMLNRTNPTTSVSQIYQRVPSPSRIFKDDYFFVFGMQDGTASHFIDNEVYNVKMTLTVKNSSTLDLEEIPVAVEPCREDHLPHNPDLANYFRNQANYLSDLYCIANGQDELIIEGAWDQTRFSQLNIRILVCNRTEADCKSNEYVEKKLIKGYFAFYSTDNLFDLNNYETPAQIFGRNYFIPTTTTQRKSIYRLLRTNKISSNEGFISDSVKNSDYFSFDSNIESFDSTKGTLVDFFLRKSYYETTYTRKYKKIQSVFAELSGFLQIIYLLLYALSFPFIKKEYYENLTNSIFNFEVEEQKDWKNKRNFKAKRLSKKEKLSNILQSQNLILDIKRMKSKKDSPEKQFESKKNIEDEANSLFKAKDTPLKMGFLEIIRSYFSEDPELKVKANQRKKGISTILTHLDITYVLKKLAEIDKLKMLVLDEDQYNLFEYLPKPVILRNSKIHLNYVKESIRMSKRNRFSEIIEDNDAISKIKTLRKALFNIINKKKEKISDIDRKLVEGIDQNFLKMLHEDTQIIKQSRNDVEIKNVNKMGLIEFSSRSQNDVGNENRL